MWRGSHGQDMLPRMPSSLSGRVTPLRQGGGARPAQLTVASASAAAEGWPRQARLGTDIAEPGSVMFQFTRRGVVRATFDGDSDEALLTALDAGAEDAVVDDDDSQTTQQLTIYTDMKELHAVRQRLVDAGLNVIEAELSYLPASTVDIAVSDTAHKVIKLMDALDELDDVVATHSNFDITADISS